MEVSGSSPLAVTKKSSAQFLPAGRQGLERYIDIVEVSCSSQDMPTKKASGVIPRLLLFEDGFAFIDPSLHMNP